LSLRQSGIVGGNVFNCDLATLVNGHGPISRRDENVIWVGALAFEDTVGVDVILGVSNNLFSRSWEVDFESPVDEDSLLNCELDLNSVLRNSSIKTIDINLSDGTSGRGRRHSSDGSVASCEASAVVVVIWHSNSGSLGYVVATAVGDKEWDIVRSSSNSVNTDLVVDRVVVASLRSSSIVGASFISNSQGIRAGIRWSDIVRVDNWPASAQSVGWEHTLGSGGSIWSSGISDGDCLRSSCTISTRVLGRKGSGNDTSVFTC